MLNTLIGDERLSYLSIKNWIAPLKRGKPSGEDEKRPGRPIASQTI